MVTGSSLHMPLTMFNEILLVIIRFYNSRDPSLCRLGRKKTTVVSMVAAGIFCMSVIIFPEKSANKGNILNLHSQSINIDFQKK